MSFKVHHLSIPDLMVIESESYHDGRGFFMETFKKSDFERFGLGMEFVQDNLSRSKKGTIRGLHYQKDPTAQGKLLRVLSGAVYEVAVDIRRGSPTFGKYAGVKLTSENGKMFWIPPGFAAGMISLADDSLLAYKTTAEYSKEDERGIIWNDPYISVSWPLSEYDIDKPIISEKDLKHPDLKNADINFVYSGLKEGRNRKILYRGDTIQFEKIDVKLPNGSIVNSFPVVKRRSGAIVAPVISSGNQKKIMLIKQWRKAMGLSVLEVPAGGINQNESPEEAAKREVFEEAGMVVNKIIYLGKVLPAPDWSIDEQYHFIAICNTQVFEQPQDDSDEIERILYTFAEVAELLKDWKITDLKSRSLLYDTLSYFKSNMDDVR